MINKKGKKAKIKRNWKSFLLDLISRLNDPTRFRET